jgi:hypothetical protein
MHRPLHQADASTRHQPAHAGASMCHPTPQADASIRGSPPPSQSSRGPPHQGEVDRGSKELGAAADLGSRKLGVVFSPRQQDGTAHGS